jgi:hypothetical protein
MAFRVVRAARAGRDRRRDDGFSILEVVAATSIIAVAFAALASVLWAGLRTASVSTIRSEASAVATRETEAMRAVPYDQIGFYGDQSGYVSTYSSKTTVSLGATTPAGLTPKIAPTGSVTVGAKMFTIARYITFADASDGSTTYSSAYKKTVAVISWSDSGGSHAVTQTSVVYPGGRGVAASATTTSTTSTTLVASSPTPPVMGAASVPAAPAGEGEIDLTWTPGGAGGAVGYFVIERATNVTFTSGFVSSPNQPATSTQYQFTGLAPTTQYWFRMRAFASGGAASPYSNVTTNTTLTPAAGPCSVTNLSVTEINSPNSTARTYLHNGNDKMQTDLSLSVSSTAACNSNVYRVKATFGGVADPGSPYSVTGSAPGLSGTVWSNGDSSWSVGTHTFEVIDAGGGSLSPAVTKTFLICASGSTSAGC